jgi:hypothetical protein
MLRLRLHADQPDVIAVCPLPLVDPHGDGEAAGRPVCQTEAAAWEAQAR